MLDLGREMERLIASYQGPTPRLYVAEVRLPTADDVIDLSVAMEARDALSSVDSDDVRYAASISGTKRIWLELDREPARVWSSGPTIDVGVPKSFVEVREVEVRDGRLLRACIWPTRPVDALDELKAPGIIHWMVSRLLHNGGLSITLHVSLSDMSLDGVAVATTDSTIDWQGR